MERHVLSGSAVQFKERLTTLERETWQKTLILHAFTLHCFKRECFYLPSESWNGKALLAVFASTNEW